MKYKFNFLAMIMLAMALVISTAGCPAKGEGQTQENGTGSEPAGERDPVGDSDRETEDGSDVSQQAGGETGGDTENKEAGGNQANVSTENKGAGGDQANVNTEEIDSGSLFAGADLEGYLTGQNGDELICNPIVTEDEDGGGQVAYVEVSVDEEQQIYISCGADTSYERLTMNRAEERAVSLEIISRDSLKTDDSLLIFGSAADTTHWTADRIIVVVWE